MATYVKCMVNDDSVSVKICKDNWSLSEQIDALEIWVRNNQATLTSGEYVADIGFESDTDEKIRASTVSVEFMTLLSSLGITLWLTEYPRPR